MDENVQSGTAPTEHPAPPARRSRRWVEIVLLAALPLVLTAVCFRFPDLACDSTFYGYQLKRAGEVGGLWWKIADDPLLGAPYQSEVARNPALFEGPDLLWLLALPSRFMAPRECYYCAAFAVLAFNGWVAAWLVRRLTGSAGFAALSIVLVTLNYSTCRKFFWHLHLFKYGWAILAVWAFAEYLQAPTRKRGILLGLAAAGVLQGSFYFGFLLGIGMAAWWLGCAIAGRVTRAHLPATCFAAGVFAAAGAVVTFPVWYTARSYLFADGYFGHSWLYSWWYGAELWQYLVPQNSRWGAEFVGGVHARDLHAYGEGWHFPGYTVLLGLGLYSAARLRGARLWGGRTYVLDVFAGLIGTLVVLSLAGGPSYFLFGLAPSFRTYGRAGLLALSLGCVLAPVALHGVLESIRWRPVRWAAVLGVAALACSDARLGMDAQSADFVNSFNGFRQAMEGPGPNYPAWVYWLAEQPADVRLAAFSPQPNGAYIRFNTWGLPSLRHRLKHNHATLNGCDLRLLESDLELLGGSYDRINPAGLRFIVSLGYNTLAFDRSYLDANPWIESVSWIDWVAAHGAWRVARVNERLVRFPVESLSQLLARQPKKGTAVAVPPGTWITGRLAVDREVVVTENRHLLIAWADANGTLTSIPYNGLMQHVYGPDIPAFTIETPRQPGRYELVVLDASRRRLAAQPYEVVDRMKRAPGTAAGTPAVSVSQATGEPDPAGRSALRLRIENASPYYLTAQGESPPIALSAIMGGPDIQHVKFRAAQADRGCRSVRTFPGMAEPGPGAVGLDVHVESASSRQVQHLRVLLPADLPPQSRLEMDLPADRFVPSADRLNVTVTPRFSGAPATVVKQDAAITVRLEVRPDAVGAATTRTPSRPLRR